MKTIFLSVVTLIMIAGWMVLAANAVATPADDENAQVLKNMKEGGFDFTKPHLVDYYALFQTREEAATVAKDYREKKKADKKIKLVEINRDENGEFELLVQILMNLTYDTVTNFEKEMTRKAKEKNGKFNGWGVFQ